MYVFDATPLIYLASTGRLELVDALPSGSCLPERVYDEVVTAGIEAGHADARRIERAVDGGHFGVRPDPDTPLASRLERNDNLSAADVAVLALAADLDGVAVMDEQYGRTVADAEGVATRGTAFVVLNALKRGVIDAETARETVDAIVEAGWYCSPDLYARIRARIDDLAQ